MAAPLRVIIIGGGIGGLTLAQGLRESGVDVSVYERDRHNTDRLRGFRIHLNPAGGRALRDCLPPELFDAVVAGSGKGGSQFSFITERGKELLHLDEDIITGGSSDPGDRHYGISRITLSQILRSGIGDIMHYDKEFERYEREPGGRITAHFGDGTATTGDVLIGADGGSSRVRAQYLPHAGRVSTDIVTIAGKFALTETSRARLAPRFLAGAMNVMPPSGCGMFIAPHEFGRSPLDGIGGSREGSEEAIRPGVLFDNTQPYVFWAFAVRRHSCPVDPESLGPAELRDLTRRMTNDWSPDLRRLVAESDPATVTLIPIRTSVPVQAWESTNITLLGDAIHSMTPFRGIGANIALRDARLLRDKLAAAGRGERPLLDGIRAYETEMIDYGFAAVRASLRAARMTVGGNRAARFLVRTAFRTVNSLPALKRRAFADIGNS